MPLTFCEHVLYYSHVGSMICSLVFNSILCLCLHSEKQYQLRLYRNVLYIQCTADMLAGVFYFFTSFRFVMIDGNFFCVSVDSNLQNEFVKILGVKLPTNYFVLYCYLYPICLGLLFVPLNFYFRYEQLCL